MPYRLCTLVAATSLAACTADTIADQPRDRADCEPPAALDPYDPDSGYRARAEMIALIQAEHPMPPGIEDQRDGIILLLEWEGRTRAHLQPGVAGRLAGAWAGIDTIVVEMFETLRDARGEFPCHAIVERPGDRRIELDADHRGRFLDYIDRVDAGDGDAPALQRAFYEFYIPALAEAREQFAPEIDALPAAERRFLRSFASLATLLGDMRYPLTASAMTPLIDSLPGREIVAEDYRLLGASDLPPRARALVAGAALLAESGAARSLGQLFQDWLDDGRAPAFHRALRDALVADGGVDLAAAVIDAAGTLCDDRPLAAKLACTADLAAALGEIL